MPRHCYKGRMNFSQFREVLKKKETHRRTYHFTVSKLITSPLFPTAMPACVSKLEWVFRGKKQGQRKITQPVISFGENEQIKMVPKPHAKVTSRSGLCFLQRAEFTVRCKEQHSRDHANSSRLKQNRATTTENVRSHAWFRSARKNTVHLKPHIKEKANAGFEQAR